MIEKYLRPDHYYTNPLRFFKKGSDGHLHCSADETAKSAHAGLLVIDASDEDWGPNHCEIYLRCVQRLGRPFVLLTGDPRSHDPDNHCYWYQNSLFFTRTHLPKSSNDMSQPRPFWASVISRVPYPHRVYFYLRLTEATTARLLITMRKGQPRWSRHDDLVLDEPDRHRWAQASQELDDKSIVPFFSHHCDHPTWTHSYLNVVVESTVTSFGHTTEKTWLPIISGQLFLVYGNPGVISVLRDQGVDVFDDVFDHNHYDFETDVKIRAKKVIEVLEHFLSQDCDAIWQQTLDRRLRNVDRFWNLDFVPQQTSLVHKLLQA